MNVIVTGASGFIGAHLAVGLASAGYQVYATYLESDLAPEVTQAAKELLQVDLSDRLSVGMLLERARPVAIVHCAAMANAASCELNATRAKACNTTATDYLLQLSQELSFASGLPQFLYTSTDLVFDGTSAPQGGFLETDEPVPGSTYAQTKVAAEQLVLKYPGRKTVLRTCLVYGEPIGGRAGFLGWMSDSLRAGKPLQLFTDEFRTPVSTSDIQATVQHLLTSAQSQPEQSLPEIVNLAGSERISRLAFGEKLCKRMNAPVGLLRSSSISQHTGSVARSPDVSLNSALLGSMLGRPTQTVDEGLADLHL